MLHLKNVGMFATGLTCGLLIHWMQPASVGAPQDRGGVSAASTFGDKAADPSNPDAKRDHLGSACQGDLDGDGDVDIDDYTIVILNWGCTVVDGDQDGWTPEEGDCDDANPNVNPGAAELCNGIDDNCAAGVDEGYSLGQACSVGVGVCMNIGVIVCDGNGGTVCSASPGVPGTEVCGNGLDDNCDGLIDEGCP